jgi:hypothetical protein
LANIAKWQERTSKYPATVYFTLLATIETPALTLNPFPKISKLNYPLALQA